MRGFLLLLTLFVAGSAFGACDIKIVVASPLTRAEQVSWSSTCGAGVGAQSALNAVANSGGGSVMFTGQGSLLVGTGLRVGSHTMVHGDSARKPYGMMVVGANSPGLSYRRVDDPLFIVDGKTNVTLWNFDFEGNSPGRPLCAQVIDIANGSSNVLVTYNRITGARQRGITIRNSSQVTVRYLTLVLQRRTGTEPEGGVGIWLLACQGCIIEHSNVSSPTYYDAGPPDSEPNRWPNAAPVMDLIASYGGRNNAFRHNTVASGNSAGIYLACAENQTSCPAGARESFPTVWDNTVHHFRQAGLDLASVDDGTVVTNRVSAIDHAPLAMADCRRGTVQWNSLSQSGLLSGGQIFGALYLLWGTSGVRVSDNHIYGDGNEYAVYFKPASDGFPNCANNSVTNNQIKSGRLGHFGGTISGNTVSPNTLF